MLNTCKFFLLVTPYFLFSFSMRYSNVVKNIWQDSMCLGLHTTSTIPACMLTFSPLLPFHSSLSRPPPSSNYVSLISHWNKVKTNNHSILDLFPLFLFLYFLFRPNPISYLHLYTLICFLFLLNLRIRNYFSELKKFFQ